jgi:hypothetical protein
MVATEARRIAMKQAKSARNALIRLRPALLAGWLVLAFPGCETTDPVPSHASVTARARYDRSWSAALGAMADVGIPVSLADQSTGWIRGKSSAGEVGIHLGQTPDGTVRVQIDTKSVASQDQGLSDRLTQAYNRRMGR